MRTVTLNDRGQIVIPEEMRQDLGLKTGETLVLLQKGAQMLLRKESAVLKEIDASDSENRFWAEASSQALNGLWDKEDGAWEEYYSSEGG